MDFVDWRKSPDKIKIEAEEPKAKTDRYRGRAYMHYIEEQIRQAEERGEFANLPGFGKPLNLENNVYAGDKAMGYNLLKSNGFAPAEVELIKEIRSERERAEAKISRLVRRCKTLHTRRIPPFPSEKRAFNHAVEKAAEEYEATLRGLNRKILTLNLSAPSAMHQTMLQVESLVQNFRQSCPLYETEA
jgi:DnaJ family protein C protein 28